VLVEEGAGGDVVWVAVYECSNAADASATETAAAALDADAAEGNYGNASAEAPASIESPDGILLSSFIPMTVAVTPLAPTTRMPSPFTFSAFLNTR
jgi:hypothetical protein